MKVMRRFLLLGILCGLLLLPVAAMADSITPDSYTDTLAVGESVTITKTVTVDTAPPTSALVDVLFLFDTTGSMGSVLASATASASSIMSSASGLGDVAFGVARYDDFPSYPYGGGYDVAFELVTDLTTTTAAVSTGIGSLYASGGADGPESNLYALSSAATDTSWRTDSTRIIVWFGDSPGHDSTLEPSYPGTDLSSAIAALTAEGITVHAMNLDLGYPGWGLDESTYGTWAIDELSGQATAITDATGGSYFSSPDAATIVDAIDDAIVSTFDEYSVVTLDLSKAPAGLDVSIAPTDYTGTFDRSIVRDFDFYVTFTGVTEGTHDFSIYAMVDGGRVATELDSITVGGPVPVPEPATMLLMGIGLLGLVGFRKKLKK